jgi:hypothetical protein
MRGVCAIVTERGAGCDGPSRRQALLHQTKTLAADGEVVWSWRRDPGATSAEILRRQRGQERPLPGESTYKPQNHCAGKAGMSRLYLSNPCAFFTTYCTRCCGCRRRPAFPAPSSGRGTMELARLGRKRAAGMPKLVPLSSPGLTGRPSIPETPMIDPRGRGVLDTPHARGMTTVDVATTRLHLHLALRQKTCTLHISRAASGVEPNVFPGIVAPDHAFRNRGPRQAS